MTPVRPPPSDCKPLTHYERRVLDALSNIPIASKKDALSELTAALVAGLGCEGLTREQQARLLAVAVAAHDIVIEQDPEPVEAAQAA